MKILDTKIIDNQKIYIIDEISSEVLSDHYKALSDISFVNNWDEAMYMHKTVIRFITKQHKDFASWNTSQITTWVEIKDYLKSKQMNMLYQIGIGFMQGDPNESLFVLKFS